MPRRKPVKGIAEARRVDAILAGLDEMYPAATCELSHQSAYQLIVATILSAQCTDKRVNMVTPEVFKRWPDAAALAGARPKELQKVIQSTGFFRAKSKNLIGMAKGLVKNHGGEVPREMDALLELPGVARKTANVVLGTAFGIAVGVVVDTHVARLSARLGLSDEEDPKKIEQDLMHQIPRDRWIEFSHQIIWHGRRVCFARKPNCGACLLAPHCPAAFAES